MIQLVITSRPSSVESFNNMEKHIFPEIITHFASFGSFSHVISHIRVFKNVVARAGLPNLLMMMMVPPLTPTTV